MIYGQIQIIHVIGFSYAGYSLCEKNSCMCERSQLKKILFEMTQNSIEALSVVLGYDGFFRNACHCFKLLNQVI